jgi:hypothetical protein
MGRCDQRCATMERLVANVADPVKSRSATPRPLAPRAGRLGRHLAVSLAASYC